MIVTQGSQSSTTTPHQLVIPFYLYAAASFLVSCILLFTHTHTLSQHFFNPPLLAITHTMALGWGTMIILGAAHQLIPVLIESALYSTSLARLSFYTTAFGIPMLVYGFYTFELNWIPVTGAILVNAGVISFSANTALSINARKQEDVHSVFAITAACWLTLTTLLGLLLLLNFRMDFLPEGSVHFLSLHAHMGIVGWFLMMVVGVGARLIPMFLISKYVNNRMLWWIYSLMNAGLISFVFIFLYTPGSFAFFLPVLLIASALILFIRYVKQCYRQRIRRKVDSQVGLSLFSVPLMVLPAIMLLVLMIFGNKIDSKLGTLYGFVIFFGWLSSIIMGMTFKTLPFIVWNRIHSNVSDLHTVPTLKEFIGEKLFAAMSVCYLAGFIGFIPAILFGYTWLLDLSAALLLLSAILYCWNVARVNYFPPVKSSR